MAKENRSCGYTSGEYIFFGALGLYLLSALSEYIFIVAQMEQESGMLERIFRYLQYTAYFTCLLKYIFGGSYNQKRICRFLLAGLVTLASFICSSNKLMFLWVIFLTGAERISSEKLIKFVVTVQSTFLAVVVVLSEVGVIPDYVRVESNRIRHCLGFNWVTVGPILYFYIVLEYLFLKKGKLRVWEYVGLLGIDYYLYVMTRTRMAFALSAVFLTFFFLFGKKIQNGWIVRKTRGLFRLSPFLIAGIAIGLHMFYDHKSRAWNLLNQFFNTRLALGYNAIQTYGLKLFGQKIKFVGFSLFQENSAVYNFVDSSYVKLALEYGIIFLLLVLLAYRIIMKYAMIHEKYYLCWIILFVLVFGISEPRLVNMMFNPFLMLCVTESVERDQSRSKINRGGTM